MSNTGVDPSGTILEFIKKDIVKNIDVYRDDTGVTSTQFFKTMSATQFGEIKNKWAVGCTKDTRNKVDLEG